MLILTQSKEKLFMTDEIEIRLPFYRSFSTFRNIYLVVFALKFFIHRHGVRGDLKAFAS